MICELLFVGVFLLPVHRSLQRRPCITTYASIHTPPTHTHLITKRQATIKNEDSSSSILLVTVCNIIINNKGFNDDVVMMCGKRKAAFISSLLHAKTREDFAAVLASKKERTDSSLSVLYPNISVEGRAFVHFCRISNTKVITVFKSFFPLLLLFFVSKNNNDHQPRLSWVPHQPMTIASRCFLSFQKKKTVEGRAFCDFESG